ncbi:MAG: VOC family protein [Legionella sp.]|nr:VOC family protein [Legionella sp.]
MDNYTTGQFCWNELATTSVKDAKDFYGEIFGWEFTDHKMGDITYTMIKNGDKEFGGMWQIPNDQQEDIPPHWMGYILVDDLEKTLKKAESLGATIKMPATAAGDYGRFGIIIDPTGAHIAFWESIR